MTDNKELTALLRAREQLEFKVKSCRDKSLDSTIKWEHRESFDRLMKKLVEKLYHVNEHIKLIRNSNNKLGGK